MSAGKDKIKYDSIVRIRKKPIEDGYCTLDIGQCSLLHQKVRADLTCSRFS